MLVFPINRRDGRLRDGFQGSALREIMEEKNEKEKMKNSRYVERIETAVLFPLGE